MNWSDLDSDCELFERELASFVPPIIFDAHAHLYDTSHFGPSLPAFFAGGSLSAGLDEYHRRMQQVTPGRTASGLFFAYPHPEIDFDAANALVARELDRDPKSRGLMLVRPSMDPELIRQTVRCDKFVGLKCYHCYADEKPTVQASIRSFLPEPQMRVAHEEGLAITLHIVKSRALADPDNQEVIRSYAQKYSNARLILAHAARGFNPHHTIEGIHALRGLGNVWCDTSAVTDGGALEAIVRVLGVERLLYGSDFPITHIRGRCVAVGDGFVWLSDRELQSDPPQGPSVPTLVGLEALRTLRVACLNLRLSDEQVEAVFRTNAQKLFGAG